MIEPTYEELNSIDMDAKAIANQSQIGTLFAWRKAYLAALAQAVLAKWGTPPAVAGEPIGYLYCGGSYGDELQDWEIVADQHQCDKLNEHHGSLGKEAKLPIYTTQQPVAKVDWIGASSHHLMQKPDCGGESCDCRSYCKKVGGQHGTK